MSCAGWVDFLWHPVLAGLIFATAQEVQVQHSKSHADLIQRLWKVKHRMAGMHPLPPRGLKIKF